MDYEQLIPIFKNMQLKVNLVELKPNQTHLTLYHENSSLEPLDYIPLHNRMFPINFETLPLYEVVYPINCPTREVVKRIFRSLFEKIDSDGVPISKSSYIIDPHEIIMELIYKSIEQNCPSLEQNFNIILHPEIVFQLTNTHNREDPSNQLERLQRLHCNFRPELTDNFYLYFPDTIELFLSSEKPTDYFRNYYKFSFTFRFRTKVICFNNRSNFHYDSKYIEKNEEQLLQDEKFPEIRVTRLGPPLLL